VSALPSQHAEPSRRRASTDRVLPAEGRRGPAPKWPSGHKPTADERRAWRRLWATPQATAWEKIPGTIETVERYVRVSVAASRQLDAGEPQAALLAQLARLEDTLGITPAGLARLRWTLADPVQPAPPLRIADSDDETRPAPLPRRMRPVQ
jgi:hypothetical protein